MVYSSIFNRYSLGNTCLSMRSTSVFHPLSITSKLCFRVFYTSIDLPVLNWMEAGDVHKHTWYVNLCVLFSLQCCYIPLWWSECESISGGSPAFIPSQLCMTSVLFVFVFFLWQWTNTEYVFFLRASWLALQNREVLCSRVTKDNLSWWQRQRMRVTAFPTRKVRHLCGIKAS